MIKLTRNEIYNAIWTKSSPTQFAKDNSIAYQNFKAACEVHNIPFPSRRYWTDKNRGISTPIPPLPDHSTDIIEFKKIKKSQKDANQYTSKAYTICLLEIFKEFSDEAHPLPMRTIKRKMKSQYDIDVDRRTIYSSVTVLNSLGYIIEKAPGGYYLINDFEEFEIRALVDLLYSNNAFPTRFTQQLTKKLLTLISLPKRKHYSVLSFVSNTKKADNHEISYNIEILSDAIIQNKKVSFSYMKYNLNKVLVKRRNEKYTVSPYALTSTNEAYYLICKNDTRDNISFFRVDKIKDITLSEEFVSSPPKGFDKDQYTEESLFMYGGEHVHASFKCSMDMLDTVVDRFGHNAVIEPLSDNGYFTLRVKGSFNGLKIWALHFITSVEVISPTNLREDVIDHIKNNVYNI